MQLNSMEKTQCLQQLCNCIKLSFLAWRGYFSRQAWGVITLAFSRRGKNFYEMDPWLVIILSLHNLLLLPNPKQCMKFSYWVLTSLVFSFKKSCSSSAMAFCSSHRCHYASGTLRKKLMKLKRNSDYFDMTQLILF